MKNKIPHSTEYLVEPSLQLSNKLWTPIFETMTPHKLANKNYLCHVAFLVRAGGTWQYCAYVLNGLSFAYLSIQASPLTCRSLRSVHRVRTGTKKDSLMAETPLPILRD